MTLKVGDARSTAWSMFEVADIDQAGVEVVDVPRNTDVLRDLLRRQDSLDVGADGAGRVQNGRVGQGPLVHSDALGDPAAQFVVGEQGRAAVGVVDDRHLELRAFRGLGVDQVAGVGDVGDDGRGDPAADVARASPGLTPRTRAGSALGSMQVTM
jgi:hypothetical protein